MVSNHIHSCTFEVRLDSVNELEQIGCTSKLWLKTLFAIKGTLLSCAGRAWPILEGIHGLVGAKDESAVHDAFGRPPVQAHQSEDDT